MKREKLDQCESDVFVPKYSIPFWFHVIHKLNKFACTPLRMLTCLLEYYGLSRSGIQLLAHCDAAISPNTLDLCRTPTLLSYDSQTKEILESGNAVICFDNYNHAYGQLQSS